MSLSIFVELFIFTFVFKGVESRIDIALVASKTIISPTDNTQIKCVVSRNDSDVDISFGLAGNVGNGFEFHENVTEELITPESWPGKQLNLPEIIGSERVGIYYCSARDKVTKDGALTMVPIMANTAYVFPKAFTYTTSVQDDANMEVVPASHRGENGLLWVHLKNGRSPEVKTRNELQLSLPVKNTAIQGTYLVLYPNRDIATRVLQQAVMRLIIRGCPEEKYGRGCRHDCKKCKNNGQCELKTGECICPPGFKGELCEETCGHNKFGADCEYSCDEDSDDDTGCRGKQFCLADPYGCSCATGFYGIVCSFKCTRGMYGAGCTEECHCSSGVCSPFTGVCAEGEGKGCSEGWKGFNCQEPCLFGTFGENCESTCGFCVGKMACDIFNGECPKPTETKTEIHYSVTIETDEEGSGVLEDHLIPHEVEDDPNAICAVGYLPPDCKERCKAGTWGNDCIFKCHCKDNIPCNLYTGLCPPPERPPYDDVCMIGFIGVSCNETCPKGSFGKKCLETCGKCLHQTTCHHITGNCHRNECIDGYKQPLCRVLCDEGKFGQNCSRVCNCANGTVCDPLTGECDGHCKPGWTGLDCHNACEFGTYGLNCSEICGKCLASRGLHKCNAETGDCPYGCLNGWGGSLCDHGTLCDPSPCQNGGTCEQTESIYRCDCSPGFVGSHCSIKQPPCLSNPCRNNGLCIENPDRETYTCRCMSIFTGVNCEVSFGELDPDQSATKKKKLIVILSIVAAIVLISAIIGAILYFKLKPKSKKFAPKFSSTRVGDSPNLPSSDNNTPPPVTLSPAGKHVSKAAVVEHNRNNLRKTVPPLNKSPAISPQTMRQNLRNTMPARTVGDSVSYKLPWSLRRMHTGAVLQKFSELAEKQKRSSKNQHDNSRRSRLINSPKSGRFGNVEFMGSPRPTRLTMPPSYCKLDNSVGKTRRRTQSLGIHNTPRDAEEEFEMETRRGSLRHRPWESMISGYVPPKTILEEPGLRESRGKRRRSRKIEDGDPVNRIPLPIIEESANSRNIEEVLQAIEKQANLVTRNSRHFKGRNSQRRSRLSTVG